MWPRSRDGKLAFFGVRLLSPGRHATILHDHVYGILGLAAEFQCEPRGGQKPFLVDYSKPVEQVYATATAFLMQQHNSLHILQLVQDPKDKLTKRVERSKASTDEAADTEPLPSWCLDYSFIDNETFRKLLSSSETVLPSPWGSQSPSFRIVNDRVLFAHGIS